MPFDNPRQPPFGDIELLWDARSRIGRKGDWVQGRFQDGNRHCLVAALSLAAGRASFNMPKRLEGGPARAPGGTRHCLVAALSLAAGSASFNMPNRLERRLARLVATNLPSRL